MLLVLGAPLVLAVIVVDTPSDKHAPSMHMPDIPPTTHAVPLPYAGPPKHTPWKQMPLALHMPASQLMSSACPLQDSTTVVVVVVVDVDVLVLVVDVLVLVLVHDIVLVLVAVVDVDVLV
jgi:hypothetical protein